jgi:hypothetical protein
MKNAVKNWQWMMMDGDKRRQQQWWQWLPVEVESSRLQ